MELSSEKIREYTRRIMTARMRLLCNHGFYGLLLMHVGFNLTDQIEYAGVGKGSGSDDVIFFNPNFLEQISDKELDYVLMHEILHIVLRHSSRTGDFEPERFNIACDIVVNSNILKSNGFDENSIRLRVNGGVQSHTAPNGKEGYNYTAEELYELVPVPNGSPIKGPGSKASDDSNSSANSDIETDSDSDGNGNKASKGRAKGRARNDKSKKPEGSNPEGWDNHNVGGAKEESEDDTLMRDVWAKRFEDACEAISLRDPSNERGLIPAFAERLFKEMRKPQTDWRSILNEFVQEEINDYSFSPPDKRFEDSPFFLPDYNEKDDSVEKVLFMIDTSGSMSDDMITAAYSEIKGAIDQFNGKFQGWLGFFDAAVIEPRPFGDEEEFLNIRAAGGGGTDFQIIFEYVAQYMQDDLPVSIIILTDGYAPFPDEELANNIPVLWLLNNEEVNPPWGKVARIKV